MMKRFFLTAAAALCVTMAGMARGYSAMDKTDPITLSGDTVVYRSVKFVPSEREILVDMSLSEGYCAAHPHTFRDFNTAAQHLKPGTAEEPMTVWIAPGVYWIDNPDDEEFRTGKNGREPFGIIIDCNALQLRGLTSDARNVVLAAARGHTQGAWGNFTMMDITADDFLADNLTLGNFCNVDLEFPLKPELGRKKRKEAITQAHVAYLHGDRAVARNVRFISRLNMNPLNGAKRILFDGCHLESTDDALTGTGVYMNCTLDFYAPRPFWNTHATGAVFLNCDFTLAHNNGRQYFCKSVGPLSIIDCRYHASSDSAYVGWTHYPTPWLRCYQSNVTLNGKPVTIGSERAENTVDITDRQLLEAFRFEHDGQTVYNTYNLLRGDDGWDPMGIRSAVEAESRARGRDLGAIPSYLGVTPREDEIVTAGSDAVLHAKSSRHGGYGMACDRIRWKIAPADERFVTLTPMADSCLVRAINVTDTAVTVNVTASTEAGHQAVASLTVKPELLPAPEFNEMPSLKVNGDTVTVNYALNLGSRDDKSVINWYRATKADLSDGRQVAVSRYGVPMKSYPLSRDDAGRFIYAEVIPAHIRSTQAPARMTKAVKISNNFDEETIELSTDFANFPTAEDSVIMPGAWTVGGFKPADTEQFAWGEEKGEHWYYGTGINGATGRGLSQRRKGARLLYTPREGEYSDMHLELLVDPAKTAGQGFGSATGQYLDVAVKFDTSTLTGYALRIIRTTDFSNAVSFYLVEYDHGVTSRITEPVAATCYRTGCSIILDYTEGLLTAHVSTATPLSKPTDERLSTEVNLQAQVEPNPFGGISIQHTGSTGEGATMLHALKLKIYCCPIKFFERARN